MVTRIRAWVVVGSLGALGALGALGCYDMERLDPGAADGPSILPVDDFEDPTFSPKIPDFGPWRADPFDAAGPGTTAKLDPDELGFGSAHSLVVDFVLTDANEEYTGASLGIMAMRVPLDVRRFSALYVSVRFDGGDSILPPSLRFYADLNCNSAPPREPGTRPLMVSHIIDDVTTNWQQVRLADAWKEPGGQPDKIVGAPGSCLAVVDAIRFTVSMIVPDGATVSGRLYIDDVYFE